MKLTLEQVNAIKVIPNVNSRKDALQNIVIKQWFLKPRGVFIGFTSIGKSYCIAKIIRILNIQKPDATTCIVVPTNDLKDDFEDAVKKFDLKHVSVFVVNTLSKKLVEGTIDGTYDLFVADELHTLCNDASAYFSQVVPLLKYKYFFGVSATLETKHTDYLSSHGLEVFFEVPLEDGYRTAIVPEYCIYNIPVEFTEKEKEEYATVQRSYLSIVSQFTVVSPHNPIGAIQALLTPKGKTVSYGGHKLSGKGHSELFAPYFVDKTPGNVMYLAITWQQLVTKRRTIIAKAHNGLRMILALTKKFDEPAIIVCGSKAVADFMEKYIPDSKAYHSTTKGNAKNKKDFTEGKLKYLLVVKGLKEGYNNDKLRLLIRHGYTGKALDLTQYLGRLLRPDKNNPNKFSVLINIYIEDYVLDGFKMESQQKKWLKSSLYKRSFVEWVLTLREITI